MQSSNLVNLLTHKNLQRIKRSKVKATRVHLYDLEVYNPRMDDVTDIFKVYSP